MPLFQFEFKGESFDFVIIDYKWNNNPAKNN